MKKKRLLAISIFILVSSAGRSVEAVPLNPNNFASLGTLPAGDLVFDTDALSLNGVAGGVLQTQVSGAPDIAVFVFDGGAALGNVTATGSIPLALLFQGSATVVGTIDVSGGDGVGAARGFGVAGGGDGGRPGPFNSSDGGGPGGGQAGSSSASNSGVGPGAGGGFGTAGGGGGAGVTRRPGGVPYGDPLSAALFAGSGGGGGGGRGNVGFPAGGGGGAGGGGLEIGALTTLSVLGAEVLANGGDAGVGFRGGGGGSGGGVLLHAFDVLIDASSMILANGGNSGNISAAGGCGGAGRVEILHNTSGSFDNQGTVQAVAGTNNAECDASANVVSVVASTAIGSASQPPPATSIPAPQSGPLFLIGLIGLALLYRRRAVGEP